MSLIPGVDPRNLAEAGWGVIFHEGENPDVREALRGLLEHRKLQASSRFEHLYREFSDRLGFRGSESKNDFLARNGATAGPVNPQRMPYYLLIVGDPKLIPFQFQQQLDTQHAVGRICFDKPEEYECYARSVVEVETSGVSRGRRINLFGVSNPDDLPTKLSTDLLIRPLAHHLTARANGQKTQEWEVRSLVGEEATKKHLTRLLHGEEAPTLFFTASHGLSFSCGDPLQRTHQGALLCQDWPGPKRWQQSIPLDYYFSGDDVKSDAHLKGMIAFHLASHSAGTPVFDEFVELDGRPPKAMAPYPFVAHLPQRLLGHPMGGALAVVGYVGMAWPYSFLLTVSRALETFESTISLLMDGYPVGLALEYFNQSYAEWSADLAWALQKTNKDTQFSPIELTELWMSHSAQNLVVLGDPAVRLS